MKTLILYASKHGTTETIASQMQDLMGHPCDTINLGSTARPDLARYDQVIVGGSVHAGRIQQSVRKFCHKNTLELKEKRLGLFIVGMFRDQFTPQFEQAFPPLLRQHAFHTACFEGEYKFDRMKSLEKMLVKKITGFTGSHSRLDPRSVEAFARKFR